MRAFLALTFYFGIVKKDLLISYWSADSVLITTIPWSCDVKSNLLYYVVILHCCNNSEYISKGQPGYSPKKKFGEILSTLKEKLSTLWSSRQHISIDKGMVPFKGNIKFTVYNPNKPDKHGIKTFKLGDSTNGYCCSFDIYVGETGNQTVSKYGKTYDLVMSLVRKLQETRIYSTDGQILHFYLFIL